ncbi:MAG: glycerophosphodiester phosphodiesterase [SAR202 cluster bacterium]|nr:glycerophosphodiester phosphodiesterase [SAR202 cluster bacterium]
MPASNPRVIAHRGASAYAPENTLAAFDAALALGAREAEMDVHLTRDGHAAVIHDATVDRTTDGSGPVASLALAQLQALDAGTCFSPEFIGQRVPSLDEVLARYKGRLRLHIEIKPNSATLARLVADLVREHGMAADVSVISFRHGLVRLVHGYAPDISLGLLARSPDDKTVRLALETGAAVYARAASLTGARVRRLHGKGLSVVAWDVPDERVMARALDGGVDGIALDFPDWALAYLKHSFPETVHAR